MSLTATELSCVWAAQRNQKEIKTLSPGLRDLRSGASRGRSTQIQIGSAKRRMDELQQQLGIEDRKFLAYGDIM
jgi:hypothetical protein